MLAGYNCTLFAYGQTGSGKTWTMEGKRGDPANEGIVPRMVNELYDKMQDIMEEDETIEFTARLAFVEIYNEKVRDLLEPGDKNIKIYGDSDGVRIEGVRCPYVSDHDSCMALIETGHANRAVASTRMNDQSSRSHAVFILFVTQHNVATGVKTRSKLMMVDLAGSEKVGKTEATGQTLEEAKNINKSLMTLGTVIATLVNPKSNSGFVPYRNSVLTRFNLIIIYLYTFCLFFIFFFYFNLIFCL